ncbi:MAG: polymer-forming cytoskeletal protein [Alphaproteobacteria bacterium]|nr:polymer-forming cytoskeletal protein [Alphaproteobacteria bacterium]
MHLVRQELGEDAIIVSTQRAVGGKGVRITAALEPEDAEAEIGGAFEGGLVVRKKLVIRSTGKVQGTVRYGRIVIEAGGEVTGTIEVLQPEPAALALPTSFRLPEPGQE